MMLVHGLPGLGKSHIVYRWAEESGAVYLRANVDWTPKYFLVELAKALNVDSRGTAQQLFERSLRVLIERQCPIIIDESEFTLRDQAAVLEKIRDFSDRAEVTVVLIGMSTKMLKKLGIDLENDSVNTCLAKYRDASPGLTMSIVPRDANGEPLALLLFCSDPENAQKIKDFSDSLD